MYVVIYSQVSSNYQNDDLCAINLSRIAESRGWYIKRKFQEKICEVSNNAKHSEFESLMEYIEKTNVDVVLVSEISAVGKGVDDIVSCIKLLHEKGIALYINQFNLLTFENGQETPAVKMLLEALGAGAEIERSQRLGKQREGIKLARTKGVYCGRKKGANTSPDTLLKKYKNITELFENSELSIRAIAKNTNHSINTVRKVKQLKGL